MIDSWILSKLEPLEGKPVIILCDPQRMIVSGAHVLWSMVGPKNTATPCYSAPGTGLLNGG